MAFFIKDTFATLWKSEDKEKYIKGSISTSEKDREGKYANSNWNVMFVGESKDVVRGKPEKTRIKILSGKVTVEKFKNNEGKEIYFTKVTVFKCELSDGTQSQVVAKPASPVKKAAADTKPKFEVPTNDGDEDSLPF